MGCCSTVVLFIAGLFAILKIYSKLTTGWCKSQTTLVGKTTIITGANTGIGYETALDFAKRGARVILACRDRKRAEEAREKIIAETGNENVVVKLVDMTSLDSVRAFAKNINETEDRLDILVNNAGIISFAGQETKDGHPLLMQVNYFSSFLLTNLLIDLLKKSTPSRIVNVSSLSGRQAYHLDLDEIDKPARDHKSYGNSKLCNILFTMELAKKLQGTGVTTYSLHPGLVKTDIFNTTRGYKTILYAVLKPFGKTCEEGAQTTIYCSVAKGIEKYNGQHFSDCKMIKPYSTAMVPGLPKKLWEKTKEILKSDKIQL